MDNNILKKEDAAYIAGIIDGEGCIYIRVAKRPVLGRLRNTFYGLMLEVKQTDKRLVEYLVSRCGGKGRIERRATLRGKMVYAWIITGNQAETLLKGVYEWLVCKREQADIAFRFRKTFNTGFRHNHGTPLYIIQEREWCYHEMKRLHGVNSYKGNGR